MTYINSVDAIAGSCSQLLQPHNTWFDAVQVPGDVQGNFKYFSKLDSDMCFKAKR